MLKGATWPILSLIGVLWICPAFAAKRDQVPSNLDIPDSPAGYDQQFQALFSAWSKKDNQKLDRLLADFEIPSEWFVQTFGGDEGAEMSKLYSDQFDDFKLHISRNFGMATTFGIKYVQSKYGRVPSQLLIRTDLNPTVKLVPVPKPPPESIQPLPPIQRFSAQSRVRVRNEENNISSWMDSYLYIDGKFRFLGRGAYPFWDAARIRLADPCAKPGEQTGGKLIARVEPEYPQSARERNIEGYVTARLTVAPDGTVSNVEITGGPPELVDAATKAFQQWRYTPFMNCGKPVEMRSAEHIKFSQH